jgi:hypothetical protein
VPSYGDDEPAKDTTQDKPQVAPVEIAPPATKEPPTNSIPTAAPQHTVSMPAPASTPAPPPKAVDPRQPQPPTEVSQQLGLEAQSDEHHLADQGNEYNTWDAARMGQGQDGNENQSYDHQMGNSAYGDHGAGSPAIKEDGCVFATSFCPL